MLRSLLALTPLAHLGGSAASLPAALAAIPIWDQYVSALEWVLNDALANTLHSGGLAIIVFTILIKTLLLPLTVQSLRSSKAMQELQPKIKELTKKHGKDRQAISRATMELYAQYHVNPVAGCLPMIVQIPIFFGLYRAIRNLSVSGTGYWEGNFLWLTHGLSKYDPLYILPIAAGVFQIVQTRMMRPAGQGKITDPQQAMMNTMMNFMPLTVVLFGWHFASGAVLYWVTQSLYSVVQQWFITGWGSLGDWIPGLPELPEHRRLGYRPPRNLDEVVVVGGEGGKPQRKGVMGWLQEKAEAAQHRTDARAEPVQSAVATVAPSRAAAARGTRPARAGRPRPNGRGGAGAMTPEPETAPPDAAEPRPARRGSSYQERVDAALRQSGGRSGRRETRPPAGAAAEPPSNGRADSPTTAATANGVAPVTFGARKGRPNRKRGGPAEPVEPAES